MKNRINKLIVFGAVIFSLSLGCKDAEYSVIKNSIYLSDAETATSKKVTVDEKGGSATVSVRMANKTQEEVKVTIEASESALRQYNSKNGTNYVLLPAENYTFSQRNLSIPANRIGADPVLINIKPLSKELIESGNSYAIPVTIVSVANGPQILNGTETFLYIIDQVITTDVPTINSKNNLKMNMRKDYALTQWSVEFRVNVSLLGTNIGQYNNQAMFAASAPDGMDGEIYSRFGDAPIKGSIFQCKNQGTQFNSVTEFKPNTWYHLAIVNDGVKIRFYINGRLDIEIDSPGKITNLARNKFGFGNTDYLKANVLVSEMRFWTKAISQTQIQNNMFAINPKTEGLEAYWKLNEGSGNTFADATGNGNTAVSVGQTTWVKGVRSDEQK
ncbi:DUF1735 and LamG domain-containing protein [Pedobacter gandavensis]|uniref:DUF1735 and LamG domain-containing protein n=1 Tax=Pedobacter gandavensis TaxID=2679963 RepID=UPI0024797569|nr:DUF1735 and LamG domain-containing protein [Pedobacter gandavensis]WGQ11559.1 DUF1735 and LamG domain-containing protein [Pedobacter gandavensis]